MNNSNPRILKSEIEPIDPSVIDIKFREELENNIYDPNSTLNKDRKEKERFGFNKLENVKFKYALTYNRAQYEEFRHRLAISICNDGISCKEAAEHPDYAGYISRYVEDNFIKRDLMFKLLGLVLRFDNLKLRGFTSDNKKFDIEYPVITEFRGHFLEKCRYFKRNGTNDGIEECVIPVVNSKIII